MEHLLNEHEYDKRSGLIFREVLSRDWLPEKFPNWENGKRRM